MEDGVFGVIEVRYRSHLSLFFVDSAFQRQGIATEISMTLDELITKLEKIRTEYGGDLPIYLRSEGKDAYVDYVECCEPSMEHSQSGHTELPRRVVAM